MNHRVETAIKEGRCVLAIGGRALRNPDVLAELRRRSVPAVALGGEPVEPALEPTDDTLAPAVAREGGLVVLVEPEGREDARGLAAVAEAIRRAGRRPRILVAARAFNPFLLPMSMRLLKIEQVKARAVDFLSSLSVAAPAPAAPAAQQERAPRRRAPLPVLAGREAEVARLADLLREGSGAVVVRGAPGSGRRWLVERVLGDLEGVARLPDVPLGRGVGADTLLAVLAAAAREGGDERLHDALRARDARPAPADLARLVAEVAQGDALAGKVLVLDGIDRLYLQRRPAFYRAGRLELVLEALLVSPIRLRLVVLAARAPVFFREGAGDALSVVDVPGLDAPAVAELLRSFHVEDVDDEVAEAVRERTRGHALSVRALAATLAEGEDVEELLEQRAYLRVREDGDLAALRRHVRRRVGELDARLREALATAAMFRAPVPARSLRAVGVGREQRLELLARGLLDQTPAPGPRRYRVHPLVAETLSAREVYDFDRAERLAEFLEEEAAEAGGVEALALRIEANRWRNEARRTRGVTRLPYPDNDALMENVRGLIGRNNPRPDIARRRVVEGLRADPRNPELLLLDAAVRRAEKAKRADVAEPIERAAAECPTPDVFFALSRHHLERGAKGRALEALRRGIEAFPTFGALQRRLATLLLARGDEDGALEALRASTEHEPLMPDAWALMGEIEARRGHLDEAERLLAHSLELDPDEPLNLLRMGELLRLRALSDDEHRDELLERAEAHLQRALDGMRDDVRAMLALGTVILDRGGDLGRAEWLLRQAVKRSGKNPSAELLAQRARVLVRQEQHEEAERLLERAARQDPHLPTVFVVRAESLVQRRDLLNAVDAYRAALERLPEGAPGRAAVERDYEAIRRTLDDLIRSGRAAQALGSGAAEAAARAPGPRGDAAARTVRRKRLRDREPGSEPPATPGETAARDDDGPGAIADAPAADAEAPADGETGAGEPASPEEAETPPAEDGRDAAPREGSSSVG